MTKSEISQIYIDEQTDEENAGFVGADLISTFCAWVFKADAIFISQGLHRLLHIV